VTAALYEKLRLLVNFFYPSTKLLDKRREGARIYRRYDPPHSPARRLLDCPGVTASLKDQLRRQMTRLDPFLRKGQITQLHCPPRK
jgi:hypothetical protein